MSRYTSKMYWFLELLTLLLFMVSTGNGQESFLDFQSEDFVLKLAENLSEKQEGSLCQKHVDEYLSRISNLTWILPGNGWAFKSNGKSKINNSCFILNQLKCLSVLDSTGKLPDGVMQGNFRPLGNPEECQEVEANFLNLEPFR